MTMDPQPPATELVTLLQRVRAGRKAEEALAQKLLPSARRLSVLQSNCLDNLRALVASHGEKEEVLAYQFARLLPQSAPGVIHWFEQLYAAVLNEVLDPLLAHRWRVEGEDPWVAQFQAIQDGNQARECLSEKLRDELRRRADKLKNLFPKHLDASDLVNSVFMRLLDWLILKFKGHTDAELWEAAFKILANKAIDWSRRPDVQRKARPIYADDAPDPGSSPSRVLVEAELKKQAAQAPSPLRRKIDTHPEADRLLFLLHTVHDWTYAKLAELLGGGATEDSVGRRVRAVADNLRGQIEPD